MLFDRLSKLMSYRNTSSEIEKEVRDGPKIVAVYSEEELEEDERERAGLEKRYWCPSCRKRMYAIAPGDFYCNECNHGYTKDQLDANPIRNKKGHVKAPSDSQIDEESEELCFLSINPDKGMEPTYRRWTVTKQSPDGRHTEIHVKGDPSKLLPFGSELDGDE